MAHVQALRAVVGGALSDVRLQELLATHGGDVSAAANSFFDGGASASGADNTAALQPEMTSSSSATSPSSEGGGSSNKRPRTEPAAAASDVRRVARPGGVLDPSILAESAAIAQQTNCVGCDGRGLAEAIARALPYACSYADRRRMPPANKFAVPEDRATPGTIDVRLPPGWRLPSPPASAPSGSAAASSWAARPRSPPPPPSGGGGGGGAPIVINMNAQWEMGAAGKYNRVTPPAGVGPDSRARREAWFAACLDAIARLAPEAGRPASLAFPEEIGCGLAGGEWARYDAMIVAFARENPDVRVTVCRWAGGGGGGGRGRGGRGRGGGGGGGRGRGGL